ncbi:hypothetical protein F444_06656 [Phytophthora nicotianae P1976]|uniref:Uncharacterized protein n=1 Tax=Phytophthora nicotianae P1976 TaxID=1317066 RepID=A0A081AHJ2_PHYNI|nr:hypothetical protein F444_06656 [Phytophthora nicotianae P1976]
MEELTIFQALHYDQLAVMQHRMDVLEKDLA